MDYHQLLCLLCSDFPRSIITEAIRFLDPQPVAGSATSEIEFDPMFNSFKLAILQKAISIFFYYFGKKKFNLKLEFMENLKKIFQEAESASSLNINDECSTKEILSCIQNYLKRTSKGSAYPLPSIEGILETLAYSCGLKSVLDKRPIVLAEDVVPLITDKISYKQFCNVIFI